MPDIWLGLTGARPHRFGMDTGSTAIVVSAEHFIPGPRDVSQGPGRLVYNSSGRILSGEHWLTDVVIRRDEHTPVATARVHVLSDRHGGQAFAHGFLSLSIALRMVTSLRMQATMATLAGFPAARIR